MEAPHITVTCLQPHNNTTRHTKAHFERRNIQYARKIRVLRNRRGKIRPIMAMEPRPAGIDERNEAGQQVEGSGDDVSADEGDSGKL